MHYAVYYPDEGRYSSPLSLRKPDSWFDSFFGRALLIINTGEVIS